MSKRTVLQINASIRPGISGSGARGSHTRRLSRRFREAWQRLRPEDEFIDRDVGLSPPIPIDHDWMAAAFTPPGRRTEKMAADLRQSDELCAELIAADLIAVGMPMYNFGVPAPLKSWIDNIVRPGVTFGFDRARGEEPHWPLLPLGKKLLILTSRGDSGFGPGERNSDLNHADPALCTALAYLGVHDVTTIGIEHDAFGGENLAKSIAAAELAIEDICSELAPLIGSLPDTAEGRAGTSVPEADCVFSDSIS